MWHFPGGVKHYFTDHNQHCVPDSKKRLCYRWRCLKVEAPVKLPALTELLPIVALLFFSGRRLELLSALTATPTGIPPEISSQRLIGLWYLAGEKSQKF